MRLSEIARILNGEWLQHRTDEDVEVLVIDSRKSGDISAVFFALMGPSRDGHDFVQSAYEKGIRNFIVSKRISGLQDANVLLVKNTTQALQQLGEAKRSLFDIPVVGITGSNGKTIVKEWLSWILSSKYQVVKSPKSYNSQVGVPLSVWGLDPEAQIGVFEAGVSMTGEMDALQSIIQPTLGVFTNIGEAHSAGFSSQEIKLEEKLILFRDCQKIFYRKDHTQIDSAIRANYHGRGISWSLVDPNADLFYKSTSSGFEVVFNGVSYLLKTPFKSQQDIENVFHAISVAIHLGLSSERINERLAKLRPVSMRLELKTGANQVYILDDSYNNDLAGLRMALEYMEQQPHREIRTVILSDILQSGQEAGKLYSEVNQLLKNHRINRLIAVGPDLMKSQNVFSISSSFFNTTEELLRQLPAFSNELVLVKGARNFELERVVAVLEEKSHGTTLEVNMESLIHNLTQYKGLLRPETKVMVMVKAFAYGGGLNEIAHLLQFHQVDYLGVAYLDEGIQLRRGGIKLPILVINPEWDHLSLLADFQLEPEIYSLALLERYISEVKSPMPIQLKLETGMNRLGFEPDDLDQAVKRIKQANLKVSGVFTHFSSSENPQEDEFTRKQADRFDRMYSIIESELGYSPIKHALNSSGMTRWTSFQYDMVRLGIGLYGYDSSASAISLKRVSTLKTRVSQVKNVDVGDTIGYNRVGKVKKAGRIATLSIGYADGYLRAYGKGKAFVLINGKEAPTIGNICMDMTMVDVTGIEVSEGDEAVVFGDRPTISQLAEWCDTIPYEILTNIGQRVKRVFISE